MCIFGGGGGARAAEKAQQAQADQIRKDADEKAGKLREGMTNINNAFGGFDDDYFSKIQRDYTDYAMPDLQDQYDTARKDIVYSLARKGSLNSSIAGDQYGLLDKELAKNMQTVEGTGADYANKVRSDVASHKQDVIGQLNTTYDVGATTDSALQAARSLGVTPSFSPLGEMFTNISALAAQHKLASEGGSPYGSSGGAQNYSGSSSSSSYVRP